MYFFILSTNYPAILELTFSMMMDIRPSMDWFRPKPGPEKRSHLEGLKLFPAPKNVFKLVANTLESHSHCLPSISPPLLSHENDDPSSNKNTHLTRPRHCKPLGNDSNSLVTISSLKIHYGVSFGHTPLRTSKREV